MAYLTRIIRLINLLCSRQVVSMSTIRDICGIPKRTAYRQLQQISQAGFPVHYDERMRGYRLYREGTPNLSLIGPDDTASILTALVHLRTRVNESYRGEVDNLVHWVVSSSALSFEKVLPLLGSKLEDISALSDLSQLLSEVRIRAALESDRQVRIVTDAGVSQTGGKSAQPLSMRHKGSWFVVTGDVGHETWNELSSVVSVSIDN